MPQSYSYWRRVDFVRSDTLIRSAIARWRLAGVEWLRAIFAIFHAPVPLVDAASALVLLLRSCHRAAHHSSSCSPPTAPPSSSSSPLPPFVQYFSFPLVHVLPRILVLTPQRIRRTPSGPAVHFARYPPQGKAYPDPEWSSRSSSLAIRRQEGVSGPRVVQAFIFTRYPPPGRRIRTAGGSGVHLHLLSASRKAFPDRDWSRRLSSLAIRRQEAVSRPRLVQAFVRTRYPPPERRIGTPSGPAVHIHSLSATGEAFPDRDRSYRLSSLAIRRQEAVSRPRLVQAFVRTRYPPPERRIGTPSGPAVHIHSLSATGEAFPDRDRSYRSSSLAIRCQEGVSGPRLVQVIIFTRYPPPGSRTRTRVVQPFIFTRYPPPGRRIRTLSGPGVHPHSLSASRKAYRDPEWSSRSSSLAARCQEGVSGPGWSSRSSSLAVRLQEGVSGPRVFQPFIFTRYPPPGRRIRTLSGPGVHPHSLSASRKAYRDPEWSSRSSSLAVLLQEGVSGPRVVQPFIFTRYPLPGRRIRTAGGPAVHPHSLSAARKAYPDPSGPGVHLHSLSAARKAYRDPEWSSRSSSLALRCQEGVSRPRMVQPFIFSHCPPPGRRIQTATGPTVHLHSLSAARKAYPDPEWSSRSSSLAIRHQEGVSGPRVVQAFIRTRYPPPERRIGTPSGPVVHLHSLSAARKAYPDPGWSSRSSSLAVRLQEGVSGPRVVQPFIFTRYPPPGRRIRTAGGPAVQLHSLSAARKAYPDRGWSSRSASLAIRRQEGVSGPRVVQAFIFTRCPLPGRRIQTTSGPGVYPHSLSAARKASPDPERSSRSSSLAIRRQEGVPGPPVVHPFIFTRYPPPGRRTGTPSVQPFIFYSLSAARKAYRDPQWSLRSSSVAIRRQEGGSGPRLARRSSSFVYPPPGRRIRSRGANRSS